MKGMSLRNYPLVLRELRGTDAERRMLQLLPIDVRDALGTGRIVASSWYPVDWKCAMHEAGRRATGEAGLARIMGHEMTRRDLQGVYRVFMRIVSPRYVLSVGARLFSSYLRPGTMTVTEVRPGYTQVEFAGCQGFSHDLWLDVAGGCEAALQGAGAANVRLRILAGGRDGDAHSTMRAWWTPTATDTLDPEQQHDIELRESRERGSS
jgi:hypothetical protein